MKFGMFLNVALDAGRRNVAEGDGSLGNSTARSIDLKNGSVVHEASLTLVFTWQGKWIWP